MKKRTSRVLKWFFFMLLISLAVYQVMYLIGPSFNQSINTYNNRLPLIEENIVRGDIVDRDGMILATNKIDEDGMYRYYPNGEDFCHVVGYSLQGKTGIEALADIYLLQSHSSFEQQLFQELSFERSEGDDAHVTLDGQMQLMANELLGDRDGAIIAMVPDTGEILCMVSKPGFDPNDIEENWNELITDMEDSPLLNRGTQGLYPPGSTYKIITTAGYLMDNDALEFSYYCYGSDYFGNKEIHCYGNHAHGQQDLEEAFYHSCNTSFAFMGQAIDLEHFQTLNNQLLFNTNLPYPLPYSQSQFILGTNPTDAMLAETVIGQGETLITPLHNLLITAAVANGGVLEKPYLVAYVEDTDGNMVVNFEAEIIVEDLDIEDIPVTSYELLDADLAELISSYMLSVVEYGTGRNAAVENFQVAGKTGTAQNETGNDHAWFVGFAPYNNPEIAIVVLVEEGGGGGSVAAPIAGELIEYYLNK